MEPLVASTLPAVLRPSAAALQSDLAAVLRDGRLLAGDVLIGPHEGSVTLASSEVCRHQALRVGQQAYGIQYHVEREADTIANWGDIPAYATALEKVQGEGALARMDAAARPLMPAFARNARRLYDGFVRMALEAAA